MRAYFTSLRRLFRKHIVRLISLAAIVAVSIGFMSGVGEVQNRIKTAQTRYYASHTIADLTVKCTRTDAPFFSEEETAAVQAALVGATVLPTLCLEEQGANGVTRLYACPLSAEKNAINRVDICDGRLPQSANEVVAESGTDGLTAPEIGDTVTVLGTPYTVCGIVRHPLFTYRKDIPSYLDTDTPLRCVLYSSAPATAANELQVVCADRTLFHAYRKPYKKYISEQVAAITQALGESATVLTLYENMGLYSMHSYADKVGLLSVIFVVFFSLVTLLVAYATTSRLFDEDRGQIACLKTLGYSDVSVLARYLMFMLVAVLCGGLCGLPVGMGLTYIVYQAFGMQYTMPPFPAVAHLTYFAITSIIIVVVTLLWTGFAGIRTLQSKPAQLLQRKAPRPGRKVLLERIPWLWRRFSFKYKSTIRNILLFRSRFWMTVISVIGATVLMLAGFGLTDCALKAGGADSILTISVALIVFSALLCALVLYNLTNINVSERNREIATLMVLGYFDGEVTGYIYREIYIMSAIGALLGVPCGYGFLRFVFRLVNFGAVTDMHWYTWLIAPAVTILFCCLSTLLLRRKIVKTDMNASLKTLE